MKYLTKREFVKKVNALKEVNPEHWGASSALDRWEYHHQAIKILKKLKAKKVLEAGSLGITLTDKSDTIDFHLPTCSWRLSYTPTYYCDLTNIPWNSLSTKRYDVFVALRVFHHYQREKEFLEEMFRVADHVILVLNEESANRYESIKRADERCYCPKTKSIILFYEKN